eukprot:4569723-Prymnesium_polylepis.1
MTNRAASRRQEDRRAPQRPSVAQGCRRGPAREARRSRSAAARPHQTRTAHRARPRPPKQGPPSPCPHEAVPPLLHHAAAAAAGA